MTKKTWDGQKKGLSALASKVNKLASDRELRDMVEARVKEFESLREDGTDNDWFSEMCFCLLTANSTAQLGIDIQSSLGMGCIDLPQKDVQRLLASYGHRFARPRADFICRARQHVKIKSIIDSHQDDRSAREWLVENILGLGYKEASHFLRNTGHFNVAILDRHILRIMEEYSLIPEIPKTLTKKRYLEIEKTLEGLSRKLDMPLGVLDIYLWYMKTGEILK